MSVTSTPRAQTVTLGAYTTVYTNNTDIPAVAKPLVVNDTRPTPATLYAASAFTAGMGAASAAGAVVAALSAASGLGAAIFLLAVLAVAFFATAKYFFTSAQEEEADLKKAKSGAATVAAAPKKSIDLHGASQAVGSPAGALAPRLRAGPKIPRL